MALGCETLTIPQSSLTGFVSISAFYTTASSGSIKTAYTGMKPDRHVDPRIIPLRKRFGLGVSSAKF
jgi:hypothetical protein